ncbi:putative hmg-CoA reductase [Phaeosphaeriaceae sp. PMI808]|nr:putative hmg-CoA reductase [Phaeosphaeriaceae sp. PMI808]
MTAKVQRTDKFDSLLHRIPHIQALKSEHDQANIENFVGYAKVPLGLAGPLRIQGSENTDSEFYAPLATVEPTLVASCSRGSKALHRCGGVHFRVLGEGMSRAPVFIFADTADAVTFAELLPSLYEQFARDAESTSRYARLQKLTPHIIGSNVHVHFSYSCGDAAGQNMVTIATQQVCDSFMVSDTAQRLHVRDIIIEGQMASDKKPSWGNVKEPRGVQVIVWARLSDVVCQEVLGCTTERLYQAILILKEGGIRNGQFGCNINAANIIAAMFISCGQDAASVAEGCWSHLTPEYDWNTKELKLAMFFPSLPVAVVGGGTIYATQYESLRLLECQGSGGKRRFAGLVGAFALALDMSTIAAIANKTFAKSHAALARGKGQIRNNVSKL